MYDFKRSLSTLIGLLVLIGVVAVLTPFKGYSQPSLKAAAVVQDVRIVNQPNAPVPAKIVNTPTTPVQTRDVDAPKASNIVTLYASAQTSNDFRRVASNGALSAAEFVVPANRVLVVTDVVWRLAGPTSPAGSTISLAVIGAGGAAHIVHVTHLRGDDSGDASLTESMKTGFAAAEGAKVSMTIAGIAPKEMILHGYLAPAN
ncbi:MAG: hypothetical protein WCF57_07425 [Pyrinomonadaceae bacterium]